MPVSGWAIVSSHLQIQKKHHSIHAREDLSASWEQSSFLFYTRKLSLQARSGWIPQIKYIPQMIRDHSVLAPGAQLRSLTRADSRVTSAESFHCTWAPQLCFRFLWVNTHLLHLILNDIFPLQLNGTAQSFSCYFRLFLLFLEFPYTEAPFYTSIYLF